MGDSALAPLLFVVAHHDPRSLIELRYRDRDGGMRQVFEFANRPASVVGHIRGLFRRGDVFIGAAPRTRRDGSKAAVERVWCLWADCDGDASVGALADFEPEPSIVIQTGSGDNVQAWWPLAQWIAPEHAERLNRKIAHALGADMRATDAARILRPPGTRNHKHTPATEVRCIANAPGFTNPAKICALPDPPQDATRRAVRPAEGTKGRDAADALLTIPATVYVPRLTGREVSRTGHAQCPFHRGGQERTPSLMAYDDPAKGWFCFGCDEGGTVYDLAAKLWGLDTRGDDFAKMHSRLREELAA